MNITKATGLLAQHLERYGLAALEHIELDDVKVDETRACVSAQRYLDMSTGEERSLTDEEVDAVAIAHEVYMKYGIPAAMGGASDKSITDATNREMVGMHSMLRESTKIQLPELGQKLDGVKAVVLETGSAAQAGVSEMAAAVSASISDGCAAISRSMDAMTAEEQISRVSRHQAEVSRAADTARRDELNAKQSQLQSDEHDARLEDIGRTFSIALARLRKLGVWALAIIGLLLAGLIAATVLAPRAHAQFTNANIVSFNSDHNFWDSGNHALRVNVVAGGAGGGLAQLQVGQASDGAFVNVGYFAGQLNVPVNCVVGCSGGASTPGDAFATPTTASLNMAFPMVWNGSTWDRWYGDKTNGAYVNIKAATTLTVQFGAAQHIICDSGCTPGGSTADDSAFSFGTTALNPMGAVVDDTSTNTVAENSIGTPRMNTNRILYVDLSKTAANTNKLLVTPDLPSNAAQETGGNLATLAGAVSASKVNVNISSGSIANTTFAATQGTSPWVDSITTWGGGTLGAMANYGTSPGAVLVPGVNAYVTNSPAVTITSGTTTVTQGTGTNLHTVVDSGTVTANISGSIGNTSFGATQGTSPWVVSNGGTFAVQAASTVADGASVTLGAKADAKSTATDTTAISAMSVLKEISAMEQAPASRAVTNAGTFAVQAATTIADGADVTLGAKTDAKNTATDATSVSAMQVLKEISAMEQAPASRAVTNAGTFAVQAAATLAAETTKVIGTVNQGTSPWVVSNGGTFATQSAVTAASGSIASGAVASGAFASGSISDGANVTLGAKTDAKSTATDATSVTVMQVLKEISAMEQAPASRAVTNAGTFAVQSAATLNAETTKVIGTVRNLGNAGAIFDGPTGSAVPANAILTGGTDGTNTRARYYDPCAYSAWTYYYFNVAANTQIAAAAGASKNYYLCEFTVLPVTAATTVNLVSSATAGNACATSTTAWLTGGTTAATGATVAVNGGFVMPPTASRAYAVTQATNHAICIFASATVTGVLAYAGPL